jgi:hypothetical protein
MFGPHLAQLTPDVPQGEEHEGDEPSRPGNGPRQRRQRQRGRGAPARPSRTVRVRTKGEPDQRPRCRSKGQPPSREKKGVAGAEHGPGDGGGCNGGRHPAQATDGRGGDRDEGTDSLPSVHLPAGDSRVYLPRPLQWRSVAREKNAAPVGVHALLGYQKETERLERPN